MQAKQLMEQFALIANAQQGIQRLREMILQLAVQGKLVPQEPSDEPAAVLLAKIQAEKERLIQAGTIKRPKPLPPIQEDEKPFELPNGWEWVRLNDIGITATGKTPSTQNANFYNGRIPFVGPGQITTDGRVTEADKFISEEGRVETTIAKPSDILMVCIGGSIGKVALLKHEVAFNQQINTVSPLKISSKFLYLVLSSPYFQKSVLREATGSATPIINRSKWEFIPVTVASLAEQARIVAKVDALMALCDELEALQQKRAQLQLSTHHAVLESLANAQTPLDLKTAWQRLQAAMPLLFTQPQQIKGLRDTILQLAVRGKLVPQDPTDEPAAVLLAKISAEKERLIKQGTIKRQKPLPPIREDEKPFELPQGWEWVRLMEFATVGTGSTPARDNNDYYEPAEINWVTSGETGQNFISFTKEKISLKAIAETNVSIYPIGTLIVAMYGQGKTRGQVSELLIEAGTNQACAAIQLIEQDVYHRQYVKLFFKKSYEELRIQAAGGAQPNLNVAKIANTLISLPPLAEKKRIVAKVDALMALCDEWEARLQAARHTQEQFALAAVALS